MNHWRQFPFARLVLCLIAGIVFSFFFPRHWLVPFVTLIVSGLIYLILWYKNVWNTIDRSWIRGLLLYVILASIGWLCTWLNDSRNGKNYFEKKTGSFLLVRVADQPIELAKTVKAEVQIKAIGDSAVWQPASGKLLLYIQRDETSKTLKYGDELVVSEYAIQPVEKPMNPNQFDYSRYLHFKNIHHTAFIKAHAWKQTPVNSSNAFFKLALDIRDYLQGIYTRYIRNLEHRGIVEALVFGYTGDLDKDVLSAYSKTGIIHVLSVSGLHVGIVYHILNLLIAGFKKKSRYWALFPISALWFYALITGFSPSVTRAVLMFSMFQFSMVLNRESNIYNGLFFSCFVLLIINPFWLSNVGFQLSYMAVFGIVFIQEYIKKWWQTTDWFWDQVWTLMAVSISAQLITFPLCLYYFHQYPNLFFISNLFVIPLIFVVLILAIILPVVSFWPPLAAFIAYLIDIYLSFINNLVLGIQDLPYAFFENLYINFYEMISIYACMAGFLFWLIYKKRKAFLFSIASLTFVFTSVNIRILENRSKNEWIVFSIKNHYAFGLKTGIDLKLFTDSELCTDKDQRDFHFLPYFIANAGGRLHIVNFDSIRKEATSKGIWKFGHKSDTLYVAETASKRTLKLIPGGEKAIFLRPSFYPEVFDPMQLKLIVPKTKGQPKIRNLSWYDLSIKGFWSHQIPD